MGAKEHPARLRFSGEALDYHQSIHLLHQAIKMKLVKKSI
jgi:hypothetical protein